jgi:acetylornithine deacetylase/succinyl-diaminopimelate desuccinylase-like protein
MTGPHITTNERLSEIAAERSVHRAFQWFHLQEMQITHWQRELTEIPAPPFAETARAEWLQERFIELGLSDVHTDEEGNVIGSYLAEKQIDETHVPGKQIDDCVVVSAHVDTIFAADTPVAVREEGGRLYAPGISDNGCGLAALLALAAAMRSAEVRVARDLIFVATVGEEGEGNLRGVRALFHDLTSRRKVMAAVMLDGAGTAQAVTQALGSRRYRMTVRGPGGHSWANAATPSAIVTLARALTTLADAPMPAFPRTTLNIGLIQGGSSINAIAEEATAAVDARSTDGAQLIRLEALLQRAMEDAAQLTNERARTAGADGRVTYNIELIGDRPAAVLDERSHLLNALLAIDRHLNIRTERRVASTDANIPLSLGIDAVTVGGGGTAAGVHTRGEWFSADGRDLALRRILLLVLAACSE